MGGDQGKGEGRNGSWKGYETCKQGFVGDRRGKKEGKREEERSRTSTMKYVSKGPRVRKDCCDQRLSMPE
jgi:hypothetical protein